MRERADPISQREKVRVQRRLLEMLIFYGGMVTGFLLSVVHPLRRVPCLPFYRVKRRQGRHGCLRSEVLSSAVEAALATCPENGRPSLDTMVT
jgi:hypothetical protein